MRILEAIAAHGHEQVIAFQDPPSGLRGFLAIHSTILGPALGGTRLRSYAGEEEALEDALRLSRAMTYKAALAEMPAGGGKAVILAHPGLRRAAAFEAYGRVVESLKGRFFTGSDAGIIGDDLAAIRRSTSYVACESSPGLGDLNEITATGVWHGMRACLEAAGLERARVAIQGVGHVGMALVRLLKREGMELIVADTDSQRAAQAAKEFGAEVVPPEQILTVECDVLAPCALGEVISTESAGRIRARIVCGSANNILTGPEAGEALVRRGILFAPDYLVNAGGLIRGAEFHLLKRSDSSDSLGRIYDRTRRVLALARERSVSPARIADELAEARLQRGKNQTEAAASTG